MFPADETATRAISGMGTPDLIDSFGMFNYFTTDSSEEFGEISGGNIFHVEKRNHTVEAHLYGPANALKKPIDDTQNPFINSTKIPFKVHVDPSGDVARVDVQGHRIVISKGRIQRLGEAELRYAAPRKRSHRPGPASISKKLIRT